MEERKRRHLDEASVEAFDADAIARHDGSDGAVLWQLPFGVWEADFVMLACDGSPFIWTDRAGALAWLQARGKGRAYVRPEPVVIGRVAFDALLVGCARAHDFGRRGSGAEAARAIADAFEKAGLGEPFTYLPERPKPEGLTKRLFEHGSQQELDRDCARSFVYGVERLWLLPPGSWDAEYVVKTGQGVHTKLTGISRREAAAWLDRAGIDSASHLPEEPAIRS